MRVKHNLNAVIYHMACMLGSPEDYFSRSTIRRRKCREHIEINHNEVSNPDISLRGLKERTESIWLVMVSFLIFGATLSIVLGLSIAVFRLPGDWAAPIFSFCFYFISVSLVIWCRYCISIKDYRTFERLKDVDCSIENFKVSRMAEPKIYDLLTAIPFAVLFYLYLLSN